MDERAQTAHRVLIFAEAVTLAHVARPLCFARGLDRARYRVAIAAASSAARFVSEAGFEHIPLDSIEPQAFLAALARGGPVYDDRTLRRYVGQDLDLIARFAPALIVGDFRLSLSASAKLAKVPYLSICSAYWSPHYSPPRWIVPSLPLTQRLPIWAAQAAFTAARPLAFVAHSNALNAVRRHFGLPALRRDLRNSYTDADFVAYSDLPELFPLDRPPPTHSFVGPALWQPAGPLPPWWHTIRDDLPCVYVSLGSSGDSRLLPLIIEGLLGLPVNVLVASGDSELTMLKQPRVWIAQYLPGLDAARRSRVVISNGGSLTAYQALAGGASLVGIAANLDQFLNMQAIERAGLGCLLRADRLTAKQVSRTVGSLLSAAAPLDKLRRIQASIAAASLESGAEEFVSRIIGGSGLNGRAAG